MPSPSIVLLRTQSDTRLVTLARDGHERAFEAIVERYRRQLLRACRRVLPEARAEDALQQTLVSAWRGLQRGDEVRELRPWLHRIAHNTSLNLLRQSGYDYEQIEESLQIADAPDDELARRAVVRQTLQGLAALPPRQREALLAIAIEGRSQDEVAGELGLSTGAVRQLVHRARTTLRTAATAVAPLPLVSVAGERVARRAERPDRGAVRRRRRRRRVGRPGEGGHGRRARRRRRRRAGARAEAHRRAAGPRRGDLRAPGGPGGGAPVRTPRAPRRVTVSAPAARTPEPAGGGGERRTTAGAPQRQVGDATTTTTAATTTGAPARAADPPSPTARTTASEDRSGPSGGEEPDRSGPSGGSDDEPELEREDRSGPSLRTGSSGPGSGGDAAERELAEPSSGPSEEPDSDSSGPGSGAEYESHDD